MFIAELCLLKNTEMMKADKSEDRCFIGLYYENYENNNL
jgi:hypothetical protein